MQIERRGASEILAPLESQIASHRERWADKTLEDVCHEMPINNRVDISNDRTVEAPVLDAIGDRDELGVVLALPLS